MKHQVNVSLFNHYGIFTEFYVNYFDFSSTYYKEYSILITYEVILVNVQKNWDLQDLNQTNLVNNQKNFSLKSFHSNNTFNLLNNVHIHNLVISHTIIVVFFHHLTLF